MTKSARNRFAMLCIAAAGIGTYVTFFGSSSPSDSTPSEVESAVTRGAGARAPVARRSSIIGQVYCGDQPCDAQVALLQIPSTHLVDALDADDGGFAFTNLPGGDYLVAASRPDGASAQSSVLSIGHSEHATVRLVLRRSDRMLRGTVEDVGGGPVPGALVVARAGQRPVVGIADADGGFSIAVAAGTELLETRASGYVTDRRRIIDTDRPVEIQLEPAALLSGRVVEAETEAAVAGASVQLRLGARTVATVQSDPAGAFELRGVGPGNYQLVARKAGMVGYLSRSIPVDSAAVVAELVVPVAPAASLTVALETSDGGAPTGVSVTRTSRADPVPETVAADGAEARFAGLLRGHHQLEVTADGYATAHATAIVGEGANRAVVTLTPEARIDGRVLTAAGEPVPGARVASLSSNPPFSVVTGADGTFELVGLAPGPVELVASHDAHGRTGTENLRLEPGANREVSLRFAAGQTISGRVRWSDGEPVPRAHVVAASMRGSWRGRTRADGTFELTGVAPGQVTLSASLSGAYTIGTSHDVAWQRTIDLALDRPVDDVELTLERGDEVIAGRVVFRGEPVPGVRISARRSVAGRASVGDDPPDTYTTDDGRFELRQLASGSYTVTARSPHYATASLEARTGARDLELELASAGRLVGTVTRNGAPVRHFSLWIRGGTGDGRRFSLFDPDGRYDLGGLPTGKRNVIAIGSDGSTRLAQIDIRPGAETRADFQLEAGVRVHGLVVGSAGQPAPFARVTLGVPWGELATETDSAGRFELDDVPRMGLPLEAQLGDEDLFTAINTAGDASSVDVGTLTLR